MREAVPGGEPPPQRLLVVSATIGEGHNATARAVEERARALWPGCEIRRVDTLKTMGRGVGPGFRWIYRVNVNITPWLYEFFYRALWRHPWFAKSSCRVVGAWSGRRLAPVIADYQPDLVVSTYPLGTGGLDWIRRHGELDAPVAAIVSDFAPHPFWVYSEVDLHYVASEPSLRAMQDARPDARGAVGAPPVVSAFQPAGKADKITARRRYGLPERGMIVLVSCGSLGFGSMRRAVDAGLAADPEICLVVACGHNEKLRRRLVARGAPPQRLVVLGWTADMATLTAAADVVVNNAGGATALEAVACGRMVLMFEPIAGHGRANAELMAQAGLATLCERPADLTATLRELAREPARLAEAQRSALAHIGALDLGAEIAALPALPRHHGSRRLSAPDAFFAYTATAAIPQQVGAALLLEDPGPPELLARHLAGLIADRAPTLPMLARTLELRRFRRPRWLPAEDIDPARHLHTRTVGAAHGQLWPAVLREFFSTPVPLDRPPWQLAVVHDADTGRSAVLAKLHHALGDGLAVTAALIGLLTDRKDAQVQNKTAAQVQNRTAAAPRSPDGRRARVVHGGRVLRGLVSLAAAGLAPGRSGGPSTPARSYAMVEMSGTRVRSAARAHRVSTTALLLALVAEAVHRSIASDPEGAGAEGSGAEGSGAGKSDRLRVMVPQTTRAQRRVGAVGNRTAAVALDLPVGPMSADQRVADVAAALARLERAGQPAAAQMVMNALGRLPAPLHARLARVIYGKRFFTLIASVLPGSRRTHRVLGARVAAAFPVLPLADGVGLAVGFLAWGPLLTAGVSTDTGLFADAEEFAGTLLRALDDLAGGASAPGGGPSPQ
ncbi:MAG: wax ester/triacylglycerol synthase domain-containing protein [Pseudonocardiales bacterium]